ncbi:MAG: Ig-like domain-containing protein, partial [Nevskiales bacterium]
MKRFIPSFSQLVSRVSGLLVALLLSACGSGGTGEGNTLASLAITDTSFQRPAGVFETFQCLPGQLLVLGTFDDGSQDVTIADRATWTSSNPNAVRVSNRDLTLTTGETLRKGALVVTGNTGDTATITAQFVGLSASQDVIVRAGTVEVSPTQVTIASGTLIQMFATAVLGGGATDTPGTNRVVGFNDGVIWESTNPAVATVDSGTGVVTAVAAGPVTIRARAGVVCPSASDAETVVTVNNPALQSITLQPTTLFSLSDIGRNTLALVRL